MELERYDIAEPRPMSPLLRGLVIGLQKMAAALSRHWLALINGFWGLLLVGALLAPTFMAAGWEGLGRVTYSIYSFTCHQLPERSFFLYAPGDPFAMHEQSEIVAAGADNTTLLTRREFVGSEQFGWKTGFSDRMFSMYGGAFLGGLIFWALSRRRRVSPIPLWLLFLMVLPMGLDGTTHLISDTLQNGFRETNSWAMPLFGNQPATFYSGTTFGSLNSNLRWVTGLLFGIGMMLFAYPLMALSFEELADDADAIVAHNSARVRELEQA